MNKNILFLVTGMTPQIITETLYGLAADPENLEQWIPDEIHVLTTAKGKIQIKSRLFQDGIFERFIDDFGLQQIQFDESMLHVIKDAEGNELDDLKTLKDNEKAANDICRLIKKFTSSEDTKLHVSIAGGRKTMGFYAGYALSLYGRAQDSMSHILVSEEYEFARNFYYPTPYEYFVEKYNSQERLNAQHAKVFLANIPFVRLKNTLSDVHPLMIERYEFSDVIDRLNEVNEKIALLIDVDKQRIVVNEKQVASVPPRELAMLLWFAKDKLQGGRGFKAPTGSSKGVISDAEKEIIEELTVGYLRYYEELKFNDVTIKMTKDFFETTKSKLKRCLEKQLGLELAAKILPKQKNRGMPFYLPIEANQIDIKNNFHDVEL